GRFQKPRESLSRGWAAYDPVSLPSSVSHRWFLVVVFAAIGLVIATSFVLYSAQPPRPPPTENLVFSPATFVDGNASFTVQDVSHGPYLFSGFQISLIVNDFAGGPVAVEPNKSRRNSYHRTSGSNARSSENTRWDTSEASGVARAGRSFPPYRSPYANRVSVPSRSRTSSPLSGIRSAARISRNDRATCGDT